MSKEESASSEARDIHEFFAADPVAADSAFFGRETCFDRRGFLRGAGLAAMAAMVGAAIPFHHSMPAGLIPAAFADEKALVGKDGLTLLNKRPLNAETPPHLLDDPVTPTSRHFIRNNGVPPTEASVDAWTLTVDGLVERPMTLSIGELRSRFEVVTMALVIECGGNGRAFFKPPVKGSQWTHGAVACSQWTGVRLKDVLAEAGVRPNVVYTAHCRRGRGPLRSARQVAHLARRADRQGDDGGRAHCLWPEWRPDSSDERGAAAARRSRLAGVLLAEMAPAHLPPRRRARRPQDGRGPPTGCRDTGSIRARRSRRKISSSSSGCPSNR